MFLKSPGRSSEFQLKTHVAGTQIHSKPNTDRVTGLLGLSDSPNGMPNSPYCLLVGYLPDLTATGPMTNGLDFTDNQQDEPADEDVFHRSNLALRVGV
ncbi:hypothetical protein ACLOJK_005443 [Asimina triloba]